MISINLTVGDLGLKIYPWELEINGFLSIYGIKNTKLSKYLLHNKVANEIQTHLAMIQKMA